MMTAIQNRLERIEDVERRRLLAAIDTLLESFSEDELSAHIHWLEQKVSIAELRQILTGCRSWLADHRAARNQ